MLACEWEDGADAATHTVDIILLRRGTGVWHVCCTRVQLLKL